MQENTKKIHCVAIIVTYHCHKVVKGISHCPVFQMLILAVTEYYKALNKVRVTEAQNKHKPDKKIIGNGLSPFLPAAVPYVSLQVLTAVEPSETKEEKVCIIKQ